MFSKRHFLLISLVVNLLLTNVFSQINSDKVDSLIVALNVGDVQSKSSSYFNLVKFYIRTNPDEAIKLCKEGLKIFRESKYLKGEADMLFLLGSAYHTQSSYNDAMNCYQKSYEIRKRINDRVGIGEVLNRIGLIYNVNGKLEQALDYCLQSIRILESENDKVALARAYNHLGIIYYILNDLKKSEELCYKALNFSEQIDDELVHAVSHEHLGVIYIKKKEFEKALIHINTSLEIRKRYNDKSGMAGAYENLAIVNRNLKKYSDALNYYNKSLELKKEIGNKRGIASSITGIGLTYYNMGEYEKCLSYLKQAYEMRKQLGDKRGMVSSLSKLADTYYAVGDFKNSIEFLKLSKVYNDSLLNEQNSRAIAELHESFDKERREKEILLLQKENTIQKYFRNTLISIVIFLLGITIVALYAYRSKKNINSILTKNNNEIILQKEELQNLNSQLKDVIATKDKFFSIIAHDLKSPFQGLLGYSNILSSEYETLTEEEKVKFIKAMEELSVNSYKLLENLLEWARIQTGTMNFQPEKFSLLDELRGTLSLVRQTALNKEIKFNYEIKDDIYVDADVNMIQTIVRNLLSNAIKFTYPGGTINLTSTKLNAIVKVCVIDTGIGISEKQFKQLFRVDTNASKKGTANEEGSGLGLLLCKEMVEKNGGTISVNSIEGKGSTFCFTLRGV